MHVRSESNFSRLKNKLMALTAIAKKDRVIVLPDDPEMTTKSGLHLPQTASRPVVSALVVAVGPDCTGIKMLEKVMVSPYHTGVEVQINDQKLLVLQEKDIMLSVEEKREEKIKPLHVVTVE